MQQSHSDPQFGATDLTLEDALLDRIDEILVPGTNIDPADVDWQNLVLEPSARRR
ncbi:MAG TPA: hypothetical protein VHJ19_10725 [Gammaproteobacteria bacterium]|nr:hypothetical protein [Gammaproteobacteria bacterium]